MHLAKTECEGKNSVDISLEDEATVNMSKMMSWKDEFSDWIINLCTLSIYQKVTKIKITCFSPYSYLKTTKF